MTIDDSPAVEYGRRLHPVLHVVAPIVTMSAVWGAREIMTRTYERVSGREAPIPSDPQTSWRRAIVWTAVTTSAAAVIEVSLRRWANERAVVQRIQGRRVSAVDVSRPAQ
jgi:hypothetical protein